MSDAMRFLPQIGLACALPIAASAAIAQDADAVEIKVTHIAGAVHMLEGAGGNIGISAGADGILIIDDQFDWLSEKISAALEKLQPGKPRFVLNTHFHFDHTGGNEFFGKDGVIVAHDNVRKRLASGAKLLGNEFPPSPSGALPTVTFDESLSIHFNGEAITVRHAPHAHTDGDAIVAFRQANVVHMGDLFFAGRFPFVDTGNGGRVSGVIDAVERTLAEIGDDVKIIPGHGPLSEKSDLAEYLLMLHETRQHVVDALTEGLSVEEITDRGFPERWKGWGAGFIPESRWIEIIVASESDSGGSGRTARHH